MHPVVGCVASVESSHDATANNQNHRDDSRCHPLSKLHRWLGPRTRSTGVGRVAGPQSA